MSSHILWNNEHGFSLEGIEEKNCGKNCWKIQKFVKVWKNFLTIIAIFYEKLAKTIKKTVKCWRINGKSWFLKILPRIIEKFSENFDNFF